MYFDSDASRSVITETSPIRKHLHAIQPTYGSCSNGDGTPIQYIEKGNITDNLEITVIKGLKYDLFSSVSAAKQGLTSIIDFELDSGKIALTLEIKPLALSRHLSNEEKGFLNYLFI
jgi:hypothetical protein